MVRNYRLYMMLSQFSNSEAKPFLEEIKNRRQGDKVRKVLVNYLIIRTVTICEMFLLNQAHRLAKNNPKKAEKLLPNVDPNVPVEEQLLRKYGYMRLEKIDLVFSTLLGKHFLSEIKADSVKYAPDYYLESAHIRYTTPLYKNWNKVVKIFVLRHDIVHQNNLVDLKYTDIRNVIGGMIQFLMSSIIVAGQN